MCALQAMSEPASKFGQGARLERDESDFAPNLGVLGRQVRGNHEHLEGEFLRAQADGARISKQMSGGTRRSSVSRLLVAFLVDQAERVVRVRHGRRLANDLAQQRHRLGVLA